MEDFLPIFHYVAIIVLFGLLFVEFYLTRVDINASVVKTLARVDGLYGIFSVIVIASGILRVTLGGKIDSSYYLQNPQFWVKMILFLIVGILSVPPSIRMFKWAKAQKADGALPDAGEVKKVRMFIHIEMALFVGIVVFAVLMAY